MILIYNPFIGSAPSYRSRKIGVSDPLCIVIHYRCDLVISHVWCFYWVHSQSEVSTKLDPRCAYMLNCGCDIIISQILMPPSGPRSYRNRRIFGWATLYVADAKYYKPNMKCHRVHCDMPSGHIAETPMRRYGKSIYIRHRVHMCQNIFNLWCFRQKGKSPLIILKAYM